MTSFWRGRPWDIGVYCRRNKPPQLMSIDSKFQVTFVQASRKAKRLNVHNKYKNIGKRDSQNFKNHDNFGSKKDLDQSFDSQNGNKNRSFYRNNKNGTKFNYTYYNPDSIHPVHALLFPSNSKNRLPSHGKHNHKKRNKMYKGSGFKIQYQFVTGKYSFPIYKSL